MRSTNYLYTPREYLRPWKSGTFLAGLALMVAGSFFTPAPDWDVGISVIMCTCAYLTAPCSARVLLDRAWRLLPIAILATWLSVDGFYALYWHFKDPEVLALMRSANWPASLPLYGLCAMFWVYRGSLRELLADTRAAFRGGSA